ncbi:MAG TPA: hypothetical protein VMX57_09440 [Planctomycetota bacterium]|nr:hypothetical protein [Planctomycetota bacterium]
MFRKLFLIVVVQVLVGCQFPGFEPKNPAREEYETKPASPLAARGITRVAVVALNATNEEVDVREVTQIFSTELQQFAGVRVFPAAITMAAMVQTKPQMPEQAHLFARQLGVDALIAVFITDYQPYENPRVGVMLRLYPVADPDETDTVARTALSVERVYDAEVRAVADQVRAFAVDRGAADTPMGHGEYFKVTSQYLHFVADRSFRDFFAEARRRGVDIGPVTTDDIEKDAAPAEVESSTPGLPTPTSGDEERNPNGP